MQFADLILPLPLPKAFTYSIPKELNNQIEPGMRVVVEFGSRKRYSALVRRVHTNAPTAYNPKEILTVLDEQPILHEAQFAFWEWVSQYYMCTPGEVLVAALPSALKLSSETQLMLNKHCDVDVQTLTDKEYLIYEALTIQESISMQEVSDILGIKTVYPVLHGLMEKRVILLEEEVKERYKPRMVKYVQLHPDLHDEEKLKEAMNSLSSAPRQTELLMRFVEMSRFFSGEHIPVKKTMLMQKAGATSAQMQALTEKNIFVLSDIEEDRISDQKADGKALVLSENQGRALSEIQESFKEKDICLLHGITGSGKTEIYIELMHQALFEGKQVLYLLPEIALTTQIILRLQKHFGEKVGVYHSRFNQQERVEVWKKTLSGQYRILLGARSALWLPFSDLGLIIVDEEHDPSFKQFDPAPRYNARDAALMLARQFKAKTLLGSATPSLDNYFQAQKNRIGLVKLNERYSGIQLPEIVIANMREEHKRKTVKNNFSSLLLKEMERTIEKGEQVILFQNRRGFSPYITCMACGWTPECTRCDVKLTYHKHIHQLNCHYCGYHKYMPKKCEACGSGTLQLKGFGTERIEDELLLMYPEWKVARLDYDTTRGKNAYSTLITDFEEQKINVLVGTQMVTKGLDFDHVGLVGILDADSMLNFPDFRSHERSFQLMAQVAGRSGRKHQRGKVIIQTHNPVHPVIELVKRHDYEGFYKLQINERLQFSYPPFHRLVKLTLLHRDKTYLDEAALWWNRLLCEHFGERVLGPEYPMVARIKNRYHKQFLLKVERKASVPKVKEFLQFCIDELARNDDYKQVRVIVDVDPY